jgi:hypothetical protein
MQHGIAAMQTIFAALPVSIAAMKASIPKLPAFSAAKLTTSAAERQLFAKAGLLFRAAGFHRSEDMQLRSDAALLSSWAASDAAMPTCIAASLPSFDAKLAGLRAKMTLLLRCQLACPEC